VPLSDFNATLEDPDNPSEESYTMSPTGESNAAGSGLETVLLRGADKAQKVLYQVTFSNKDASMANAASRFVAIMNGDIVEPSKNSVLNPSKDGPAKKPEVRLFITAFACTVDHYRVEFLSFSQAPLIDGSRVLCSCRHNPSCTLMQWRSQKCNISQWI
jgi:hypothetical protein